ncbi:hypothetical protein AGR4C_pa50027 [Agrobacterium tumefaciens str. Kerr 14]|uniref:Uncharacterized protein n=1 Tax=Agrobacterium tumefaciens str. Kerr 14 TaxID=1183424 RepID=A0A1S7SB40_AGRTU|nr:hypothetical protein AGR4C_pa50027 [Agrobacterium tumefaciens str. Kerr 14]
MLRNVADGTGFGGRSITGQRLASGRALSAKTNGWHIEPLHDSEAARVKTDWLSFVGESHELVGARGRGRIYCDVGLSGLKVLMKVRKTGNRCGGLFGEVKAWGSIAGCGGVWSMARWQSLAATSWCPSR